MPYQSVWTPYWTTRVDGLAQFDWMFRSHSFSVAMTLSMNAAGRVRYRCIAFDLWSPSSTAEYPHSLGRRLGALPVNPTSSLKLATGSALSAAMHWSWARCL